jgi:Fe-S-cluster containining protein
MCADTDADKAVACEGDPLFSEEQKAHILEIAMERMVLINGAVYGLEDDSEPERQVYCAARIATCHARCCSLVFALTQDEARAGFVKYNPGRPYYIARDADGFCAHLDRITGKCSVHDRRPLRCRKYSCLD